MKDDGGSHAAQQLYLIRAIQAGEPQRYLFRGVSGELVFSATKAQK